MPVERQVGQLPRWVTAPTVADWVSAAEVAALADREREELAAPGGTPAPCPVLSPEEAARQLAFVAAFGRFVHALDLTFGTDQWPSSWAGGPFGWDPARGRPPGDLVAAVSAPRARPPSSQMRA